MKYIMLILLVSTASKVSSQSQFVGGVLGVNSSFVVGKPLDRGGKFGFKGGINYTYKGKEYFLLEIGITYDQKGFTERKSPSSTPIVHHMDYLSYPVKCGLIIKGTTNGYVALKLGLVPAILINSYNNANQPTVNNYSPAFDLGAAIDMVLGYVFSEKIDLYTQLGYQQSFFTAATNFHPDQKLLNGSIAATVGLRYKIPF